MKGKVLYVASPYYHDNPWVMIERYAAVSKFCLLLLSQGYCPISPIMIWHPVAEAIGIDEDAVLRADKQLITKCDSLVVFTLNGWQDSKGVAKEVEWARELKLPVRYMNEKDIIVTLDVEAGDLDGRD